MKKKITIPLLAAFVLLSFFISPSYSSESPSQINLEVLSASADESTEAPGHEERPEPASTTPPKSWFSELLNTLFE